MDHLQCLRKLTEYIVKQQNDSLESLNMLCYRTDAVSLDISNLINSLQMVGNRQFSENRVQDEDSINDWYLQTNHQQSKQAKLAKSSVDLHLTSATKEPRALSSILMEAIKCVPIDDDTSSDKNLSEDTQSAPTPESRDGSLVGETLSESHGQPLLEDSSIRLRSAVGEQTESNESIDCEVKEIQHEVPEDKLQHQNNRSYQRDNSSTQNESGLDQIQPKEDGSSNENKPPMDRDRIVDILKRYSLYDEYEDDESE